MDLRSTAQDFFSDQPQFNNSHYDHNKSTRERAFRSSFLSNNNPNNHNNTHTHFKPIKVPPSPVQSSSLNINNDDVIKNNNISSDPLFKSLDPLHALNDFESFQPKINENPSIPFSLDDPMPLPLSSSSDSLGVGPQNNFPFKIPSHQIRQIRCRPEAVSRCLIRNVVTEGTENDIANINNPSGPAGLSTTGLNLNPSIESPVHKSELFSFEDVFDSNYVGPPHSPTNFNNESWQNNLIHNNHQAKEKRFSFDYHEVKEEHKKEKENYEAKAPFNENKQFEDLANSEVSAFNYFDLLDQQESSNNSSNISILNFLEKGKGVNHGTYNNQVNSNNIANNRSSVVISPSETHTLHHYQDEDHNAYSIAVGPNSSLFAKNQKAISNNLDDHGVSSADNPSFCAVCLSSGSDSMLLPCAHSFHAACILNWVEHQSSFSCPLCRQSIQQFVPIETDTKSDDEDELNPIVFRVKRANSYNDHRDNAIKELLRQAEGHQHQKNKKFKVFTNQRDLSTNSSESAHNYESDDPDKLSDLPDRRDQNTASSSIAYQRRLEKQHKKSMNTPLLNSSKSPKIMNSNNSPPISIGTPSNSASNANDLKRFSVSNSSSHNSISKPSLHILRQESLNPFEPQTVGASLQSPSSNMELMNQGKNEIQERDKDRSLSLHYPHSNNSNRDESNNNNYGSRMNDYLNLAPMQPGSFSSPARITFLSSNHNSNNNNNASNLNDAFAPHSNHNLMLPNYSHLNLCINPKIFVQSSESSSYGFPGNEMNNGNSNSNGIKKSRSENLLTVLRNPSPSPNPSDNNSADFVITTTSMQDSYQSDHSPSPLPASKNRSKNNSLSQTKMKRYATDGQISLNGSTDFNDEIMRNILDSEESQDEHEPIGNNVNNNEGLSRATDDLLARFMSAWEAHYYRAGSRNTGQGGSGASNMDDDLLKKPAPIAEEENVMILVENESGSLTELEFPLITLPEEDSQTESNSAVELLNESLLQAAIYHSTAHSHSGRSATEFLGPIHQTQSVNNWSQELMEERVSPNILQTMLHDNRSSPSQSSSTLNSTYDIFDYDLDDDQTPIDAHSIQIESSSNSLVEPINDSPVVLNNLPLSNNYFSTAAAGAFAGFLASCYWTVASPAPSANINQRNSVSFSSLVRAFRSTMPGVALYFSTYEAVKANAGTSPSRTEAADSQHFLRSISTYFTGAALGGGASQAWSRLSSGQDLAIRPIALAAYRFGIQFAVFESFKNVIALKKRDSADKNDEGVKNDGSQSSLGLGEVLLAAAAGGTAAGLAVHPLQRVWSGNCGTSATDASHPHANSANPSGSSSSPSPAPAPSGSGSFVNPSPSSRGPIGLLSSVLRSSLVSSLTRMVPGCVLTAVSYEYGVRWLDRRQKNNQNNNNNNSNSNNFNPKADML